MPADGASIGSVWVDVNPRATNFWNQVVATLRPGATQAGDQLGGVFADAMSKRIAAGVGDGITRGARDANADAVRAGDDSGAKFGDAFRKRVEAAMKALPKANIDGDTSEFDRKLDEIHAKLDELSGKNINLDVDTAHALEKIDELVRKLDELADKKPTVTIEVDTTEAMAKLEELSAKIDEIAAKSATIGVQVDTGQADAGFAEVTAQAEVIATLSPTIKVDADTAAAEAELTAVAAEALFLNSEDPTINVSADTGGAATNLASVGSAASSAGGSLSALAIAGIALAPAIVPAAASAAAAIGSLGAVAFAAGGAIGVLALALAPVIKAVTALDAAQNAAGASASGAAGKQLQMAGAIDQVRSAQASLANTEANAADSQRRASEAVQNAVIAETDAQRQLAAAQQAVTQARIDAARAAQDLQSQIAHNALDQRQAALDTQKAAADLATAKANAAQSPSAANTTALTEAQLAYDRQIQQNKDLSVAAQRLAQDKAKSDKAGIDGSSQVVAAQQRVTAATEAVRKAEQGVADARAAQATQARQNAFAIQQAEQGVVNAQRAVQSASVAAGNEGSAAMGKLKTAMAGLSPAGVAFVQFLVGLKPIWESLSKAAQNGLLPGLEAGIKALLPVLPTFTKFVGDVATILGQFAQQALTALASPWWQSFFQTMAAIALPLLRQMGPMFLNVAKAFAALFLAFAPFAPKIIGFLAQLAQQFAAWATTLSTNKGFQQFIAYVTANAPLLVQLFESLVIVGFKLLVAFAPLGAVLLKLLTVVAAFLAKMSPGQLLAIVAAVAVLGTVLAAAFGGVPILITAIVVAVTALVAGLVYAWNHSKTFRDIVLGVFHGVADAAVGFWHGLEFVWNKIKDGFEWLWHQIDAILGHVKNAWHSAVDDFTSVKDKVAGVLTDLRSKFDTAVSKIGSIWDGLTAKLKAPIRVVIQQVINGGLLGAYNKIATLFHFTPNNVQVPMPPGFAAGGYTGPGGRLEPAGIVHRGEYVIDKGLVDAHGIGFFDTLRTVLRGGRTMPISGGPGYADGGIVGDITSFAKSAWNTVTDPIPAITGKVLGLLPHLPDVGILTTAVTALGTKMIHGVLDHAENAVNAVFGHGSGGANTSGPIPGKIAGNLMGWINAAVQIAGVPAFWAGGPGQLGLYTLVMRESGGNPNSINLWDSNARAGHPSIGLAQTIGPTFEHYRDKRLPDNIRDPVANLVAAIHYIQSRYGSILHVQQANPHLPPKGYDSGGWLMPGLTIAHNATGKPEAILTADQWQAMMSGRLGGSDGGTTYNMYGTPESLYQQVRANQDREQVMARIGRPH